MNVQRSYGNNTCSFVTFYDILQAKKRALLPRMLWNQFHQGLDWDSFQFWYTGTINTNSVTSPELLMKIYDHQSTNTTAYSKINIPWGLKLNSGGRKRPVGKRAFGSRSSSKKGWVKQSNCRT